MKVLILSCNTGGGHNSCAKAIGAELLNRVDQIKHHAPYARPDADHAKSGQHQNSLRIQFPVEVNSGDGDHQYTEEEGYD